MEPLRRARLFVVLAALLFSTGGAAIKATSLPPAAVAGLRSGVAALVLLALVPAARRRPTAVGVATALAYAATLTLYVLAMRRTTAASVGFLQATAPLYLLVLAPLLLREPWRRRDLLFLAALGLPLAIFFLAPDRAQGSAPDPLVGNALGALTGVCWALTLCGLRAIARTGEEALGAVALGNVFAFLGALPFAGALAVPGVADVVAILWLGVFQIALAYVCATRGLRLVPAFQASLLLFLEDALNPLWSFLVHGERFGGWTLVAGLGVLVLGGWLAWSDDRSTQGASSSPT